MKIKSTKLLELSRVKCDMTSNGKGQLMIFGGERMTLCNKRNSKPGKCIIGAQKLVMDISMSNLHVVPVVHSYGNLKNIRINIRILILIMLLPVWVVYNSNHSHYGLKTPDLSDLNCPFLRSYVQATPFCATRWYHMAGKYNSSPAFTETRIAREDPKSAKSGKFSWSKLSTSNGIHGTLPSSSIWCSKVGRSGSIGIYSSALLNHQATKCILTWSNQCPSISEHLEVQTSNISKKTCNISNQLSF